MLLSEPHLVQLHDTFQLIRHIRSSSFGNLNPFKDESERYTRLGDMYDSEDQENMASAARVMYEGAAAKNHGKPSGMPHSRSEGSIQYKHRPAYSQDHQKAPTLGGFPYIRFANEDDPPILDRGRAALRSPSPVKQLDDIKEEESIEPEAPPKRAQSPIKQLFGEKGWLGRSTSMKELPSEEYRKTGIKHWGGKIKEKMLGKVCIPRKQLVTDPLLTDEKTEDLSKTIPAAFNVHISPSKAPKTRPITKFPVSLKPPEQSKLYCELELMLSAAANKYLMDQKEAGRMSLNSIQKVTQRWVERGRPQVIEFQFDLITQRELVFMNMKTFRFYGPHAENMVSLVTMLNSWKATAKEMSVRTFCTPDSVIKKQLHGTYKILELLGAALVSSVALSQIHRDVLQMMERRQAERREYDSLRFGVEMPWSPKSANREGMEALENPFENMFD